MDERRRLQFAGWSAVVGLVAAAFSVGLFAAEYTLEGSLFAVLALVFLYVAVAGFVSWWPFTSPADPPAAP